MNNERPSPSQSIAKHSVPLIVLILVIIACKPSSNTNTPTTDDNGTNAQNSTVKQSPSPTTAGRFDVNEICSLPKEVASGLPHGKLGGGSWARTSNFDEEWDYGCKGDTGNVVIEDNEKGHVSVEYGAIGGQTDIKYLTVEYTATRFSGLDKSEMELRKGYVEFVDKISKRLFKEPLPETVKARLLGAKEVKKEDSGTPVGWGYVNTSVNFTAHTAVLMDIHFYESASNFGQFKDK